MPFCTQCGSEVASGDVFCAGCGSEQKSGGAKRSAAPATAGDFASGLTDRNASILCYVPWVGWIAAIVVLASSRFRDNRDVRFNAFQGLYLFVVWLVVDQVLGPITGFSDPTRMIVRLLKVAVLGAWIFMLVKTAQNQLFRLPLIGELAERSVAEQR
jgi:uncharacterized membrane protein